MLFPEGLCSSENVFTQEISPIPNPKRKRNLPSTPDPDAEVIALSPGSLMATNRFRSKPALHRRGHNLAWKLKQRNNKEVMRKKVYLCPKKTCVHHHPSRALGDLTGIKKHYSRKHGEKKWKCDKCSKKYAVQADWKAHSKICATREYKCDCGTLFSRKDSFITHRAFCDALPEEISSRIPAPNINLSMRNELMMNMNTLQSMGSPNFPLSSATSDALATELFQQTSNIYGVSLSAPALPRILKEEEDSTHGNMSLMYLNHHQDTSQGHMSATALLQKAATMGSTRSHPQGIFVNSFGLMNSTMSSVFMGDHHNNIARASDRVMMEDKHLHGNSISRNQMGGGMTRDFLGVGSNHYHHNIICTNTNELQAKFSSMSSTTVDLGQQYSCTTTGSH
ncbi:hypothetical protein DCAR_0623240 [Daucus carota subsp. sativus]|uniref:C2H2-type domain-containing protein n=1 Tax=Daucus carota subsp. sativus TaxID=79200 RepID=A0AAF0X9C3_DAUCS|nr:hypothetical protein DCAR_0623240 [Daucus carota subsp. sativus]